MSGRGRRGRTVLSAVGRTAWAVGVLALVAAVPLGGHRWPTPGHEPVAPVSVEVPAASTVLVCPGPVRLPTSGQTGEDASYDPQFDPAPTDAVTGTVVMSVPPQGARAASVSLEELGAGRPTVTLDGPDAGAARLTGATGPFTLRADAVDDVPAWVAGVLRSSTAEGDLRGLVAASCQEPSAETWLVGGGTELGSSARLLLANPGATAATVTVRMWGATGPVETVGGDYLVPPGSERVVLLEGLAAEQRRIVVQTIAAGGLVTAYLQDSRMVGLVPGGVDYVAPGRPPADRQVVPGVAVATDGEEPVLRVLAPGEEGGAVDVTVVGEDGLVDLPGGDATVQAGAVLDIPLAGLAPGHHTVVVDADVPVVAGVMVSRGGSAAGADDADGAQPPGREEPEAEESAGLPPSSEQPVDRAWAASVVVGAPGPLAAGGPGVLVLSGIPGAPVSSTVAVEVVGAAGAVLASTEVRVPVGRTVAVPLADLTEGDVAGVVVRAGEGIAWAAVLGDAATVSVVAPVPPRAPERVLDVLVR